MNSQQRDARSNGQLFTAGTAIAALVVALLAMFLARGGTSETTAGGAAGSTLTLEVAVTLSEMKIEPASINVAPGQKVKFTVKNAGNMAHDFMVEGKNGTPMLEPGKSAELTWDGTSASTEAWCTVPGHKEAGMLMKINVTGGGSGGHGAAAAPQSGGSGSSDAATIDPNAKPAADFKPYDPVAPPPLPGTVHNIDIHAIDKEIEVAPGVTQRMWTFDGKVPGTIFRGKVGDTFNFTLYNDGTIDHSIDFHASKVAWNVEMRSIKPGESLKYSFKADFAGAWMYHCGTNPTLHHIGNGMFGAIIIDPVDLAPVDKEFVIVQSELYLGPQGKEGDLAKMKADRWDAVVFNGYYNQYAHNSSLIRVEPNQRVRVWVIDDGPSENSAFHIVGTIFDTVFKEGTYHLKPDNSSKGGSQVLDLQPAQGGFVEFSFAVEGLYPFVSHKFSNASKGAMGMFAAGNVSLPEGASH
jgi:nitrite reductase (NO-forming)